MSNLDGEKLYTVRIKTTDGDIVQRDMPEWLADAALEDAKGRSWYVSGSKEEATPPAVDPKTPAYIDEPLAPA